MESREAEKDGRWPICRQFTLLAGTFSVGILGGGLFEFSWLIDRFALGYLITTFLALAFSFWLWRLKTLTLISVSLALFFAGIGYFVWADFLAKPGWQDGQIFDGAAQVREINLVDDRRVELIVELQNDASRHLIRAQIYQPFPISYGDRLSIRGTVVKFTNRGTNDWRRTYLKYPLYYEIKVDQIERAPTQLSIYQKVIRSLHLGRSRLEEVLAKSFNEPVNSLAIGITLGQKRSLDRGLKQDLATSGLSHIVVLSGFNITIIMTTLSAVLLGRISRRQIFTLATLGACVLVLATGMSASIVRAAIFSLIVIFGQTIGRKADQLNIMLLAALVMILANPFIALYDPGFQFSFGAFAGLLFLSPQVKLFLHRLGWTSLPNWIEQVLAETIGAQIAVLPLMIGYFGQFSLIAPLTNLAVLWALPYAMAGAFAVALLGIISAKSALLVAGFMAPLLNYILAVAERGAGIPFASIALPKYLGNLSWFLYLLLAIIMIIKQQRRRSLAS